MTLLTVVRVRKPTDAYGVAAPDGLTFVFLVTRKPKAEGYFTLTELRDFRLEGASYSELTYAQLGRHFEPDSNIFAPKQVHLGRGPTVAQEYRTDDAHSAVLITTIVGAPLQSHRTIRVVAKVGWGNDTEPFPFEIEMERIPKLH